MKNICKQNFKCLIYVLKINTEQKKINKSCLVTLKNNCFRLKIINI